MNSESYIFKLYFGGMVILRLDLILYVKYSTPAT